jgi:NurA domain
MVGNDAEEARSQSNKMLDLNKLVPQIQEMTRGVCQAGDELRRRLDAAREQLARVAAEPRWQEVLSADRTEPRMALPTEEPLTLTAPAPDPPAPLTVLAVDGSQIAPDHHEVANCCLINVGSVMLHYAESPQAGRAEFASEPQLLFQREEIEELADGAADLRFGFGGGGDLDARRMIAESKRLATLMRGTAAPGAWSLAPGGMVGETASRSALHRARSQEPGSRSASEARLALMDGPLIAWPLGWLEPRTRREEAARLFLEALDAGQQLRFPVAGYISRTRSIDLIQMLKFTMCEASAATGRFCPACDTAVRGRPDPLARPCFAPIDGLLDIQLMAELLERGARSAVFESNNKVLRQLYDGHRRIGFFFINAGLEMARVEVPEWVWRDPERLAEVHAAVYRQIRLGMGYPIALSEAHEQAVVRAPERQAFFELLRRTLLRDRLPAESSAKAIRKRGPIA